MSDDRQEPPAGGHEGDETRPLPRPGDEGDETRPMPRPGEEPDDRTRRLPGPAEPSGPADATAPLPPERPWSGRAEVRPRTAEYREPTAEWYAEDQGGRRWWSPILWGILVLLLLALLGVALWLVSNAEDEQPGPEPTPSAPLTTSAPTSAAPTSAEPTTSPPTSAPPTTEAAGVPVPPLAGLPLETAEALLDRVGLSYRVEYRPSSLPPGLVIDTEPESGELIDEDDEILLLVSEATPSDSPSPSPSSPTATPTS